ncbi:MAG: hypothetical protein OEU26_27255, partial [Candidatus Tectomicrobia bacterium]|nr:hypothetical protein [Candidatus Tectomicrobia bacterium]
LSDGGTTATDDSGNGHDGTYTSGAASGAGGAIAGDSDAAGGFDGVDDYVEIPASTDYQLSDGTVSMWFNTASIGNVQTLLSRDSTGFDAGGHLTIRLDAAGQIDVRHQDTTSSYTIDSGATTVAAGEWHMMSYSWGADGMRLYLDGELVGSDPTVTTLEGNNEPWTIGANSWLSDDGDANNLLEHFEGQIDEVAVFDGDLTVADIQSIYEVGSIAVSGDDVLNGGDGNDTLVGGAGADTLDGGAGTDTADYSSSNAAVNVNLDTSTFTGGDAEGDTFTSIENVTGSSHADMLTGDANANILSGGGGNDTLSGGDGSDIFIFEMGGGTDTINGGIAGGWTDSITLLDASGGGDLGTFGIDWTLTLNSGSIQSQDASSITLSGDADGTIQLSDGSTADFYGIERIDF